MTKAKIDPAPTIDAFVETFVTENRLLQMAAEIDASYVARAPSSPGSPRTSKRNQQPNSRPATSYGNS